MAYITYEDLCDQFTAKFIDDTFKGETEIERDRIIDLFSKETETWATNTLHPFLDVPSELKEVS